MRQTRMPWGVIGGVAALVLVADQLTKAWIRAHIPMYDAIYPLPWARAFFRLTHLTNTGVAFGFFRDSSLLFVLIGAVIFLTVLLYAHHLPWQRRGVQIAVGLQLGGALGNLLDRMLRGQVTDFLDFFLVRGERVYHYPPFNLADAAIVVGVAILILCLWREEREASRAVTLNEPEWGTEGPHGQG
ncbi:MAG: signal peptidase II [Chloroflexi bacterium]|nr:signal peptidase II [Chloroflexota bacterium]